MPIAHSPFPTSTKRLFQQALNNSDTNGNDITTIFLQTRFALLCHRTYIKSGYIGMIKKTTPGTESSESEGEEGNLNNSDTNGNDITQLAQAMVCFAHQAPKKYTIDIEISGRFSCGG